MVFLLEAHTKDMTRSVNGIDLLVFMEDMNAFRRSSCCIDRQDAAPEDVWKLPIAGSDTDWREFRARLVSSEAQTPETGEASLKKRGPEEARNMQALEFDMWEV